MKLRAIGPRHPVASNLFGNELPVNLQANPEGKRNDGIVRFTRSFFSPKQNNLPMLFASASTVPLPSLSAPSVTARGVGIIQLLLIFVLGGLFFSSVMAGFTAFYGMGRENIARLWEVLQAIHKLVWQQFIFSLKLAKSTLLALDDEVEHLIRQQNTTATGISGSTPISMSSIETPVARLDGRSDDLETAEESTSSAGKKPRKGWEWKSAWTVLKAQLKVTKMTAAEGVQALRQEATLYAAAVGQPGLIPLQYILDRMMPYSLTAILKETMQQALIDFPKKTKNIKKLTLVNFDAGTQAPILEAARVYDIPNAIAFDYSVKWDSQLDATVQLYAAGGLARLPISIQNFSFSGVVRVILTPLVDNPPGYGAMLLSVPKPPKLNLKLKVLGSELTRFPFLKQEITEAMGNAVDDQLLWPRRVIVPSLDPNKRGKVPVLSQQILEKLKTWDPLLEAEEERSSERMLSEAYIKPKTLNITNSIQMDLPDDKDQ